MIPVYPYKKGRAFQFASLIQICESLADSNNLNLLLLLQSVGKVMQAAGKRWRDPTLDEWPENDHRIFVGDLGKWKRGSREQASRW